MKNKRLTNGKARLSARYWWECKTCKSGGFESREQSVEQEEGKFAAFGLERQIFERFSAVSMTTLSLARFSAEMKERPNERTSLA